MSKPKGSRKRKSEPTDELAGAETLDAGVAGSDDGTQAAAIPEQEPAGAAAVEALPVPDVPADAAAAGAAAAGASPAAATLELDAGLEIKDVESVHRRLTAALASASSLTVDLGRIAAIDTAGVQLLLALERTAAREQRPLRFTGGSTALTHALGVLGLQHALKTASGG